MAEHLREAIVHTVIAALVVEALLRLWDVRSPATRLWFQLLVLSAPVVLLPLLEVLAPFRHQDWFEDRYAIFASRRWSAMSFAGISANTLWLAVFTGAGLSLLLLDLVAFLKSGGVTRKLATHRSAPSPELAGRFADACAALGLAAPELLLVDSSAPLLLCRGIRRPAVVVSSGAVARLDGRELSGALAHELGHIAHRDVLLGWTLMAVRVLQAFNPVLQIVARAATRDAERRADDLAARATGDPLSVASGLIKLFEPARRRGERLGVLARAREVEIEDRCRRLLASVDGPAPDVGWGRARFCAATLGLGALLFLVV